MHRKLYVFMGEAVWCRQAARQSLQAINPEQCVWLSEEENLPQAYRHKHARLFLGQTTDIVVFDACKRFSPDAFGILSGTIRGGGCLLLLLPSTVSSQNRFSKHLHSVITADESCIVCKEGDDIPLINIDSPPDISSTNDQLNAIDAIKRVVYGHRNRPLVMTADRGRGKSAALGLASKELLATKLNRIILTAPAKATVSTVFEYAEDHNNLVFLSPDELLKQTLSAELLLIDEAAAIPVPILTQLLKRYSRIVFSTTVHGYEGSGKGFAIRFKKILNQQAPEWQAISLSQPIRWAENDPLEAFVNKALLLDADIAALKNVPTELNLENYRLNKINRDVLLENEELLHSLFGLLITAHYQTKPADIAYLLNDENVGLYAVTASNQVLAVICAEKEGDFSEALSREIFLGNRRSKGHLIPQSLTFHSGIKHAASAICQRIIRIAVHPDMQNKGLGQHIVEQFIDLTNSEADYIGTSFACTADVLGFWQQCGFVPARLGLKRDAANGTHSLMMLKPVNNAGEVLVKNAKSVFSDSLVYQLAEVFTDFDTELLIQLLTRHADWSLEVSTEDYVVLDSFCNSHRGYEVCLPAITRLVQQLVFTRSFSELNVLEQKVLINKVLKKLPWPDVVAELGLKGKREAEGLLKSAVGNVLR